MTPKQVILHFGGEAKAASELGMTRQIVYYWAKQGKVPTKTQRYIELLTAGKLKASPVKQ